MFFERDLRSFSCELRGKICNVKIKRYHKTGSKDVLIVDCRKKARGRIICVKNTSLNEAMNN